MAANEIFRDGDHLGLAVADTVKSGDVVTFGDELAGVAQTDYSKRDNQATVWFRGVFEIGVSDGTYAIGTPIYAHGGASGAAATSIDQTATDGVLLGHSIEAKTTTGGTGVLRVRLSA